jgi:LPXTG-motif cell wall-anchored protein
MIRPAFVLMAVTLAVAAIAVPAAAHSTSPDIRVVLDPLPAELSAITAQVVVSVEPQLVVENPTGQLLQVLTDDGRPFLRISDRGVEADVATRDWYRTNDPAGTAALPAEVRGGDLADPDWRPVTDGASWGWYDHRLHPVALTAPSQVVEAGIPARLGTWEVPVILGGVESALTGTVEYRPQRGDLSHEVSVQPAVDGLDVQLLPGRVPGLFLANRTGRVATVLGSAGEPMLRFDDDGVQANLASPDWVATSRAEGTAPEGEVDADARPRFASVATSPQLGWIELRGAYGSDEPPADVIARGGPVQVGEWEVPVDVDGDLVTIRGTTTWVPREGVTPVSTGPDSQTLAFVAMGLVVVAALAWTAWTRRRRAA